MPFRAHDPKNLPVELAISAAEYTNDICHIIGSLNFTAGALSRVQINYVEYFQNALHYEQMASSQTNYVVVQDLVKNNNVTSLQLEQLSE